MTTREGPYTPMSKKANNEVMWAAVKVLAEVLEHLKRATHCIQQMHDGYKGALERADDSQDKEGIQS